MSDAVDRSQEIEELSRHLAITNRHGRVAEQPDEEDGIRYCLDCTEIVPQARIDALPSAVRCVDCQEMLEQWERLCGNG